MYPRDLEKRSKVDQYLAWQHLNVRFGAAFTFQMRVINTYFMYPKLRSTFKDRDILLNESICLYLTL